MKMMSRMTAFEREDVRKKQGRICRACDRGVYHVTTGYCMKHFYKVKRGLHPYARTRLDKNEMITEGQQSWIVLCDTFAQEVARAIIDTADIPKILSYSWCWDKSSVRGSRNGKMYSLHCVIMGHPFVDHINRNPLDNRKSNLRAATQAQQNLNRRMNSISGYSGVRVAGRNWIVRVKINGRNYSFGTYKDVKEAAHVFNECARQIHGKNSRFVAYNDV